MAWPFSIAAITTTFQWKAYTNVRAFWQALYERTKLVPEIFPAGTWDYTLLPTASSTTVADGDDISAVAGALTPPHLDNDLTAGHYHLRHVFPIDTMQIAVDTMLGRFVKDDVTIDGTAGLVNPPTDHFPTGEPIGGRLLIIPIWDNQKMTGDAGYDATLDFYKAIGVDVAPNGQYPGFTRARAARIDTPSSTLYTDDPRVNYRGAPASIAPVNGEIARCTTDGYKYLRSAGAWVRHTDQTVDCTLQEGWGFLRPYDYNGPWIWRELYNALNLLVSTYYTGCLTAENAHTHWRDGAGSDSTSSATGIANAVADWGTEPVHAGAGDANSVDKEYRSGASWGAGYYFSPIAVWSEFWIFDATTEGGGAEYFRASSGFARGGFEGQIPAPVARSIEVYIMPGAIWWYPLNSFAGAHEGAFNSMGDTIGTKEHWHLLGTEAANTNVGGTITSPGEFPSSTGRPPDPTDTLDLIPVGGTPNGDYTLFDGYTVIQTLEIARWKAHLTFVA